MSCLDSQHQCTEVVRCADAVLAYSLRDEEAGCRYDLGMTRGIRNLGSYRPSASGIDLCIRYGSYLIIECCAWPSEEMSSWFIEHYAAKLARHTVACVAFLVDLVYWKRNELPDHIKSFATENRGEGWKKSQRSKIREFAVPVSEGATRWKRVVEAVESEDALPRQIGKRSFVAGKGRYSCFWLATTTTVAGSTDWRRGLGGIDCKLSPAECWNRDTHQTFSLHLPPEAGHQTPAENYNALQRTRREPESLRGKNSGSHDIRLQ